MASNTYVIKTANGKTMMKRTTQQGRRPRGMRRWNGYLPKDVLETMEENAIPPYITVSSMIQTAVCNYVRMELLKS